MQFIVFVIRDSWRSLLVTRSWRERGAEHLTKRGARETIGAELVQH